MSQLSQSVHIYVLIVEDNEADAELLLHTLRRGGYTVTSKIVDTPAKMRAELESLDWDIITSDHSMPQFNAPAALALAKELRPEVPFIIVSGEINLNLAVSLIKSGAKDYIQKRELALLLPTIERELREVELRRERQQVDRALAESEEHYRLLFRSLDSGFALHEIICDSQGIPCDYRFLEINPAFEKLTGLKAETLIGHTNMEIMPGTEKEWIERYGRVALTGEVAHFENYAKELGKFYEVTAYSPKYGQFAVIFRDITKHKYGEKALLQANERLTLAQQSAGAGVWDWDMLTGKLNWSPELFHLFGLDPTATEANFDVWRNIIHPDDVQIAEEHINIAIRDHTRLSNEYRIVLPCGETRWINALGDTTYNEAGEAMHMSGICVDISERKQAEEQIRQLNAKLEIRVAERTAQLIAANHELETFSYSVSHDLRAPLRSMENFSTILLEDYASQLDGQGKHYLARIQDTAQHMGQLINDLLNLSRVTTLVGFSRERVDLSELANSAMAELQAQSPQRRVVFDIAAEMIVQGDKNLLKIAIENLLNNAYKFTGQRELAIIQVGRVERDGKQTYFVRDNGAGFDMTYASRLFTPFQRLHNENEFPGMGIGLATVQRIIRRHNGRIWAEGVLDKGATFYFTID
jgi:PAS domain S-box-containing protein